MKTALIAICCNEPNVKEQCLYHKKIGFDAIYIALNRCSPEYVSYCRSLDIDGVYFTEFNPPESPLAPQFQFYTGWLKTFGKHFDWAAFLDIDEYLWLGGLTLPEFLQGHLDSPVLGINWKYFATRPGDLEVLWPEDSLLKRFTWCSSTLDKHVKPIINLKLCNELHYDKQLFFCNPHMVGHPSAQVPTFTTAGKRIEGPYNEQWTNDGVFIAHFYSKTKEEFAAKIQRGRPDCARTSNAQYFNCEAHMWEEWEKCRQVEVHDTQLLDFMERGAIRERLHARH